MCKEKFSIIVLLGLILLISTKLNAQDSSDQVRIVINSDVGDSRLYFSGIDKVPDNYKRVKNIRPFIRESEADCPTKAKDRCFVKMEMDDRTVEIFEFRESRSGVANTLTGPSIEEQVKKIAVDVARVNTKDLSNSAVFRFLANYIHDHLAPDGFGHIISLVLPLVALGFPVSSRAMTRAINMNKYIEGRPVFKDAINRLDKMIYTVDRYMQFSGELFDSSALQAAKSDTFAFRVLKNDFKQVGLDLYTSRQGNLIAKDSLGREFIEEELGGALKGIRQGALQAKGAMGLKLSASEIAQCELNLATARAVGRGMIASTIVLPIILDIYFFYKSYKDHKEFQASEELALETNFFDDFMNLDPDTAAIKMNQYPVLEEMVRVSTWFVQKNQAELQTM